MSEVRGYPQLQIKVKASLGAVKEILSHRRETIKKNTETTDRYINNNKNQTTLRLASESKGPLRSLKP